MTTQCDCRNGLGKVNGVCIVCPANTHLVNGTCSHCPVNAIMTPRGCECKKGFILNSNKLCVSCNSLPYTFLINGYCGQCPSKEQVYNNVKRICECPAGKKKQGGRCIQACKTDELLDSSGNCYSCPRYMIPVNGRCVCAPGYATNRTGCGCSLICNSNQF